MTVESFCNTGNHDVEVDADGWCREHQMIGIAPSWGKRGQRFVGGSWEPFIPRPANYIYRPRFVGPVKKDGEPTKYTCQFCGGSFTSSAKGTPPSYCSSIHRSAAANARKREARRAVAS